jgi:general secretion pathway protein G
MDEAELNRFRFVNAEGRQRRTSRRLVLPPTTMVIVVGLLVAACGTVGSGLTEESKAEKAMGDVVLIQDTVTIYMLKGGHLPVTMETLTKPDEKGRVWLHEVNKDPWGHDYVIKQVADAHRFDVVSAGPNGIVGDEDDISSIRVIKGKK